MSNDNIEYNGRKTYRKPRTLEEATDVFTSRTILDNVAPIEDTRQEHIDKIYADIAITYLKGNKLLDGLRNMEPAQFINIEPNADKVSTSANRLAINESQGGKIITYSMYTRAIDSLLAKQWEYRLKYLSIQAPATYEVQNKEYHSEVSGGSNSLISQFLAQNGIAGTIIGMLTLAPFQSVIFQTLSVEKGAQVAQGIQIPIGIALLLELGVKAEEIIKLLKSAKISVPQVEEQVQRIAKDPVARSKALEDAGISSDDLSKATSHADNEIIIDYVSQFYQRYGGLSEPNGHLTIDHWIAYSNVARNQQTIRGALNNAETFSPKFREIRENETPTVVDNFIPNTTKKSDIDISLVSVTRSLNERSNDMYDDILDAFQYNISDKDLCCLVEIFGKFNHTNWLRTIASILRISAVDLSGQFIRIDNFLRRMLSNFLQDGLFEIVGQVNEFQYKLLKKLSKIFTIDFGDRFSSCVGMVSLGYSITNSVQSIFRHLKSLLAEISSIIGEYGQSETGSWTTSADRRHLLGIARILEVLAFSIDRAESCTNQKPNNTTNALDPSDDSDAILSIVGNMPPVLKLSEQDERKFFPNRNSRSSDRLKFAFGIKAEQNNTDDTTNTIRPCHDPAYKTQIEKLIQDLNVAFNFTE